MEANQMKKIYIVRLTDQERRELKSMVRGGKAAVYKVRHANILLKADADGPGWSDDRIAEAFSCRRETVENVRCRFVQRGFQGAIERKKQVRPSRVRQLDGRGEARLIALACSEAPNGQSHWTLRLLADQLVVLDIVDEISHETVRQTLKKTN